MLEPKDAYVTYQQAAHNKAVLPTVDHSNFLNDPEEQRELLNFLYNKITIEKTSSMGGLHEAFLAFDENRKGVLTKEDFAEVLRKKWGISLTPTQIDWLVNKLDLDHDGKVRYEEFAKALGTWHASQPTPATSLTWDFEDDLKRSKARVEKVEKKQQQAAEVLRQSLSPRSRRADEGDIPSIMARLRRAAYAKAGSLKEAFAHYDLDNDRRLSKEELKAAVERDCGVVLSDKALDALFRQFDVDGDGVAVHYWEFVRALTSAPEDDEPSGPLPWSTDTALPGTSVMLPMENEEEEGDPRSDEEVLRAMADRIHERGLQAHTVVKKLLQVDGPIDAQGLQLLADKLGVPMSEKRAKRIVQRGDLTHDGVLTNWELVRLLSEAQGTE